MYAGPPPIFYVIDSSRFTFKEYLWGTKNPLVLLIAMIIKFLRINSGGSIDDPAVNLIAPFEVTEEQIPPDIHLKFQPIAAELYTLGFQAPIIHSIDDAANFTNIYWATFRHQNGSTLARIHCRTWRKTHPPKFHLFPVFITMFQDGSALFSSPGKPDSELPREVKTLRLEGKPTGELFQLHQLEIQKTGKPVKAVLDEQTLRDTVEVYHAMARDFHLRRGAFKQRAAADQQQAVIVEQARAQAAASGAANPEVLAELELLQKAPPNRANSLWILIITAAAFVLAGGLRDSFKNALLLIPILLFHEMGHYLAMYIFKYRNLQMFFIPLLGAAVTGRKYNVAGWKKVVVFLMGPLPGIILGAALAGAGIARENELMVQAAMLCIFINGFNLLPLLPFDGGRVVGIILFSRHYILDTVFRALTALGIILLGFALNATFLTIIGFFSLFAVGASFKVAKVTETVRDLKLPTVAEDGESVPPATADIIITELKNKFPKGVNKQIAQHALTVIETLNARPPGWLASIFFLGLHAFSFLFALIGFSFIVLHQRGELNMANLMFDRPPRTEIASEHIQTHFTGDGRNLSGTNAAAVVATYKKRPLAQKAYTELITHLPADSAAVLFGNTVYLRIPGTNMAARAALFEECNKGTTNTFVERTNYSASFTIGFELPKENRGAAWFKDLNEYCALNGGYKLIPPWTPRELVDSTAIADHSAARHTLHLLSGYNDEDEEPKKKGSGTDEEADRKAIAQAMRIGDSDTVAAIRKKNADRAEKDRKDKVARVKAMPDAHRGIVETYMDYPSDTNELKAYFQSRTNLAKFLGSLREAKPDAWHYGVEGGYMFKTKSAVTIHSLEFNNFVRGGPELIAWLQKSGVRKIRYRVEGSFSSALDEMDEE
jgi:Zn-dependent protease